MITSKIFLKLWLKLADYRLNAFGIFYQKIQIMVMNRLTAYIRFYAVRRQFFIRV
jgi:hypothetical protein